MSNAVEQALSRASTEQREHALKVIEEARGKIRLVSLQGQEVTADGAGVIAQNKQIIEDAKRSIPFETMQSVDEIGPPMNTPSQLSNLNATVVELHPAVQSKIESIEQGPGNNYLQGNAIDRAVDRQPQQMQPPEQERQQDHER